MYVTLLIGRIPSSGPTVIYENEKYAERYFNREKIKKFFFQKFECINMCVIIDICHVTSTSLASLIFK